MDPKLMKYLPIIGIIAALLVGVVSTLAFTTLTTPPKPVDLTLVVTDNNFFNSTVGDQPAYFVLTDQGLQSSANIRIPSHTNIDLTIINYDDGNTTIAPLYAKVQGTVNNSMLMISDIEMNASEESNGIALHVNETQTISQLPVSDVSHTFTILDNTGHIFFNIPMAPSSTIHTDVVFTQTGTFHWQCFAPCGSNGGWGGSMITPGWMEGSITIT